MQNKLMTRVSSLAMIASLTLFASTSFAQAPAYADDVKCELGTTCQIPDIMGGTMYFTVTPDTGTDYQCVVSADKNKIAFWVWGGDKFKITDGDGFHTADLKATIDIKGNFTEPNSNGQIKIHKVAGGAGTVTCSASK